MRPGAAALCLPLLSALAAAAAQSHVGLAPGPSGAVVHLPKLITCRGPSPIASVSARGNVRRIPLPATARAESLDSAGRRSAVTWLDRRGTVRSAAVGRRRLGATATHGRPATGVPDVDVNASGGRAVVWREGGRVLLQRVGAGGRPGPEVPLGALDGEWPEVLHHAPGGTTWVQLRSEDTGRLRLFRVGPDGAVVAIDLDDRARAFADPRLTSTVSDGRGGLYAVFVGETPSDEADPLAGPVRAVVHLSASGRVAYRRFRTTGGPFQVTEGPRESSEAGTATLVRTRRGVRLVYVNQDGIRAAGVRTDGRLRRPRRLRRTGDLQAVTATRSSIVLLLLFADRRGSRPDGLAVQRFPAAGAGRPAIRVARARAGSSGEPSRLFGGDIAVDRSGRIYASWWSERHADSGSGYVTAVTGYRVRPRQRLWRCSRPLGEPDGQEARRARTAAP